MLFPQKIKVVANARHINPHREVVVVQNDTAVEFLVAVIGDNGQTTLPPETSYVLTSLHVRKRPTQKLGVLQEDGNILFNLDQAELNKTGTVQAYIQAYHPEKGRVTSHPFTYHVAPDPIYGAEIRPPDKSLIEQVIGEGPAIIAEAKRETELNITERARLTDAVTGLATKESVNQVAAQLAEKANISAVRKKSEPIGLNDADADLLAAIQGGEGAAFELLSIPHDQSVTPVKTTFFERSRNLFNGYQKWTLESDAQGAFIREETAGYNGRIAVIPTKPSTTYFIKNYTLGSSNRFGVVTSAVYPTFDSSNFFRDITVITSTQTAPANEHSFTTLAGDNYALIYVSNVGGEPVIQVEAGDKPTSYVDPLVIPEKTLNTDSLKEEIKQVEEKANKAIRMIIEDPITGYPERPELTSVIWVGVNEPPDPEPFDEWREVGGFTYFEDFEGYANGAKPWAVQWGTPSANEVTTQSGEKALKLQSNGNTFTSLVWEALSNDSNRSDSEVYMKVSRKPLNAGQEISALHRGSGTSSNVTGYAAGGRPSLTDSNKFSINRVVNGVSTVLREDTAPFNVTETTVYHQVSRVDGNRLRLKVWLDGSPEPKNWLIDVTDSAPIETEGFIGVFTFIYSTNYVYDFGVGTGGMRAPRRKVL